jgi:hypothetical protein
MIHDQALVDRLGALPTGAFEGEVYRATGVSIDPTAASINGGRWAPPSRDDFNIAVLYTSFDRDGALAEVSAFLAGMTPIPKSRPIKVTRLRVSASRTVRLSLADLIALGVDMGRYGERDYVRTQIIGAALAFLNVDGLIVPSARWSCNNLVIFADNHAMTERLEIAGDEQVDWREWAQANGIIV